MTSSSIGIRLEAELGSIAERCGCELLAARYAGSILRLVLDHEEGVTIEHCERVSREASALLDVEDFASGKYVLEVSSPGLDREFFSDSDYERFVGQQIKITWKDPSTGAKRTDIGLLEAATPSTNGEIRVASQNQTLTIRLSDVVTTRLEPDF